MCLAIRKIKHSYKLTFIETSTGIFNKMIPVWKVLARETTPAGRLCLSSIFHPLTWNIGWVRANRSSKTLTSIENKSNYVHEGLHFFLTKCAADEYRHDFSNEEVVKMYVRPEDIIAKGSLSMYGALSLVATQVYFSEKEYKKLLEAS